MTELDTATLRQRIAQVLGWTELELHCVIQAANGEASMGELVVARGAKGIMPDPTVVMKDDWDGLAAKLKTKEPAIELWEEVEISNLTRIVESRGAKKNVGKMADAMWKFRTKDDRNQRRTRLYDVLKFWKALGKPARLTRFLLRTKNMDQIHVQNLSWMVLIMGDDWCRVTEQLGLMGGAFEEWIERAKEVSNLLKTSGVQDENWFHWCELQHLVGYKNSDGTLDLAGACQELANSGRDFELYGLSFSQVADEVLTYTPAAKVTLPFQDWVKGGEWATSGSASGYKTEVVINGEDDKIRTTKAGLLDITEPDTLTREALAINKAVSKGFDKPETGKNRLAVAGDVPTYLKMSWLKQFFSSSSNTWAHVSTSESLDQTVSRMLAMSQRLVQAFSLPFDYKAFDHQATRAMLLILARKFIQLGRLNCDVTLLEEYDLIAQNVIESIENAELVLTVNGKTMSWKMKGGLESGINWTSEIGNGWNLVMTSTAIKLAQALGVSTQKIAYVVKGDDSAIFAPNWGALALIERLYFAIGVQGGIGKFSLQFEQTEFLRVWFDGTRRCLGYPARAVVGLTQRKPWSNEPWKVDEVIRALIEATYTVERRTQRPEVHVLRQVLLRIWCQSHGLRVESAQVPVEMGGLGLLPPKNLITMSPPIRHQPAGVSIDIVNETTWRKSKLEERGEELYGVTQDMKEAAHSQAVSILVSETNMKHLKKYAEETEVELAKKRVYASETVRRVYPSEPVWALTPENLKAARQGYRNRAPMFGRHPEVETARADFKLYGAGLTFTQWLRKFFPKVANSLSSFHRTWHRSEALDYLAGKLPSTMSPLHPALKTLALERVAVQVQPNMSVRRGTIPLLVGWQSSDVYHSPLSQRLFMW